MQFVRLVVWGQLREIFSPTNSCVYFYKQLRVFSCLLTSVPVENLVIIDNLATSRGGAKGKTTPANFFAATIGVWGCLTREKHLPHGTSNILWVVPGQ